jgi:diacylglycerol kinase (ATP)
VQRRCHAVTIGGEIVSTRVILNPTSGDEAATEALPTLNEILVAALGHVDIVLTTGEGDAARAAAHAAREGYEVVVAAGGDGTFNEVLNGVASVDGALDRVVLGLVPLGTGNDFARALGIPGDPERAAGIVAAGHARRVDVGVVNGRHYANASAGGFIAETSARVDSKLKTLAGTFAYLVGGAQVLWTYEPVHTIVSCDGDAGEPFELQMFAVANSPYIGGGHQVAPLARPDDGLLDLCLVKAMPTVEFVGFLARTSRGEHIDDERVYYRRVQRAGLAFARATRVNTDGQVFEATRCDYEVRPGALRVLAPWVGRLCH